MSQQTARSVALVIAVAIWQGMIGVLAKWITWPPLAIVCGRCIVASFSLWLLVALRTQLFSRATSPDGESPGWRGLLISGLLLATHWGSLFWAYHLAQVGPVVVAVFTFPIMASLVEPFFFSARPKWRQILAALLGSLGVFFMVFEEDPQGSSYHNGMGILLGLLSAACFAARGIYSRFLMKSSNAITIMAAQTTVVAIAVSPALFSLEAAVLTDRNLLLVVLLGVAFTALPHTIIVWALRRLSVAASGIMGSLQVISGITLAHLFLGEPMVLGVWLGAALVILAVATESFALWRQKQRSAP